MSIINCCNNTTMLTKSMKKQLNKLLQIEAMDVPSVDRGGQLPKLDQESLVIVHIEEQMEGKITTERGEPKNSIDSRVYLMEQIIVIMQMKPLWELVWNPTKNEAFWYQKTIITSNWAQENENFQLKKWSKELGKSSKKETLEDDCNNNSWKMSLVSDDDFHKAILVTPLFNVDATPYILICSFWHGARHVVGDCFYRSNKVSITNLGYWFGCPI